MKQIKYVLIGCTAFALTACSYIPSPNFGEERANAYLKSESGNAALQAPPGVNLVQANTYYVIPPATQTDLDPMTMALPPGSKISQQENKIPQKIALAEEPLAQYTVELTTVDKQPALKVNQPFNDTWDALALALQQGGYAISAEDNSAGTIVLRSGPAGVVSGQTLQVAIYGNWKRNTSTISLLAPNQKPAEARTAELILQSLGKNLQTLTHSAPTTKPVATLTVNERGFPQLLLNRNSSTSYQIVGKALAKTGYKVVKSDPSKYVYYVIDTVSSKGKVSQNMPLYALFVRGNGVVTRGFVMNEDLSFADPSVATPMLTRVVTQVLKQ